jgi:hypothetical protein
MADKSDLHARQLRGDVTNQLRSTFETVAKLALQGSAEAGDESLNPIEKMRKAHSRITLIIDDAMRGLANAHESMLHPGS